jgi:transposase-like protein
MTDCEMLIHCLLCKEDRTIKRDYSKGGATRFYCDPCRKKLAREGNNLRMGSRYREARAAGATSAEAGALARSSNVKFQEGLAALRAKGANADQG